jgi:hypothetical protein
VEILRYTTDFLSPTPFISHPNNLKDFYKTGSTTINNISISNGFDKVIIAYLWICSESIIPVSI